MLLQSKLFRLFSISILILGLAVFAFADTIRLKDGSVIKGKIITFEGGQFVILIGEGSRQRQMRFFADEIESIKFDSQAFPANAGNDQPSDNTMATNNTPREPSYRESNDGKTTIITVGSAPRTTNPQTSSPPANTSNDDEDEITDDDVSDETPSNTTNTSKPIQINVKVLADNTSNGWTNAGWVVRKGQRIRIVGNGRISLGSGRYSGPRGISTLPDENKLIKDKPTGGLIAVIGDDNNDFIYIGDGQEFVAERDGALFLGINEGFLNDNSGSYDVTLEIATTIGN